MKFIKKQWKDYARSAATTFLAGFATEMLIHINDLTLESIKDGTWYGFLFMAVRTGMRAVLQAYIEYKAGKQLE